MKTRVVSTQKPEDIRADQLQQGQMAIVQDNNTTRYNGDIVLKLYGDKVVNLTKCDTWSGGCILRVRPLPPGTVIEFTSEV